MSNKENYTDYILATKPDFKISDYEFAINRKYDKDKNSIAEAIKRRLIQRYIAPGETLENKNGFSIMANCCLLIETFESFHRGWSQAPNGADTFCKFFNRNNKFNEFTGNDLPSLFYKNIRCGILHQGETTGGWRIKRNQNSKLIFDDKIIDANHFRDDLKSVVENYFDDLKTKGWDAYEWKMLKKKMKSLIRNCKS